ncbi:MAG: hypothetical protein JOZ57_01130, partial [Abitibacteriaceae bacterium]|nr:hypothetical protein [Abditibacteriaceae bacterium]
NQADVEAVRLAAIDFAHAEGFQRSPDDVSIQRLVGFAISPPLKRSFGDPLSTPNVLRAIFVEMGKRPEKDVFFILNYDGEFSTHSRFAVVAGRDASELAMHEELEKYSDVPDLATALQRAVAAWRRGAQDQPAATDDDADDEATDRASTEDIPDPLAQALEDGEIEAAILERDTSRESKFRMLRADELKDVVATPANANS